MTDSGSDNEIHDSAWISTVSDAFGKHQVYYLHVCTCTGLVVLL